MVEAKKALQRSKIALDFDVFSSIFVRFDPLLIAF